MNSGSEILRVFHASWSPLFLEFGKWNVSLIGFQNPPSIQVGQTRAAVPVESSDGTKCLHMIYAFQEKGHKIADLDPLNLSNVAAIDALDPKFYGFSESDYDDL